MARRKPKEDPQNALLGDLESIRTLLDDDNNDEEEELAGTQGPSDRQLDDIEVPVLEDVVEDDGGEGAGTVALDVAEPASNDEDSVPAAIPAAIPAAKDEETATQPSPAPEEFGLDDDLFRALLSDEWRDSASEILKEAREVIGEHRTDWTPAETDALNDALKVRIDQTMQGWMRGMVVTHMADLHATLLKELSTELTAAIDNIIGLRDEGNEGNEGHESNKRNERSDGK
jgi:hypothetical protein